MAVPSREEFEECLQILSTRFDSFFPLTGLNQEVDDQFLLSQLKKGVKARREVIDRAYSTTAACWLRSQREYVRAEEVVFKSSRKRPNDHLKFSVDHEVTEIFQRLRRTWPGTSIRSAEWRYTDARHAFPTASGSWFYKCMAALAEYYHDRSQAHRIAVAAKDLGPATDEVRRALLRYYASADVLSNAHLPTLGFRFRAAPRALLEETKHAYDLSGVPIRRADATASERLFVYRMWWANRKASRVSKTSAIVKLMELEGFDHQYDSRHIEKLCSEFTGMKGQVLSKTVPGH